MEGDIKYEPGAVWIDPRGNYTDPYIVEVWDHSFFHSASLASLSFHTEYVGSVAKGHQWRAKEDKRQTRLISGFEDNVVEYKDPDTANYTYFLGIKSFLEHFEYLAPPGTTVETTKTCTCPIRDLAAFGCKCGYFAWENKRKV